MSDDVRCDLCEAPAPPVWIFRSDRFVITLGPNEQIFDQDEEWGVCADCQADILADHQQPILKRRRHAARLLDYLHGLDVVERSVLLRVLDMIVLSFLTHRQKSWPGRAFGALDNAEASAQVAERGRGVRPISRIRSDTLISVTMPLKDYPHDS